MIIAQYPENMSETDDGNQTQLIQQNLKNLEVRSQKKRLAQARYYGSDRSPLTRMINQESGKQPVHARLGKRNIRLRKVPFNINNSNLLPKNKHVLRLNRYDGRFIGPTGRRNGFPKTGSMPLRLQRSRRQNGNEMMHSPQMQKIKLRRRMPVQSSPTDFTVEVNNGHFGNNLVPNNVQHSCRAKLTQKLQAEIRIIQSQSIHSPEVIPSLPIHPVGCGSTCTTLHERFSL